MWRTTIVIVVFTRILSLGQLTSDPDHLLNWCLDAKNHKTKPGPEDVLFKQCTPWVGRSCCTYNTTRDVHVGNMYNFDYDHCGHIKNMSNDCRRHFQQDLCFYECSPNIGPWAVKVTSKTRNERFHKVPLCETDCNTWFNACIDDYTCTDNWVRNWEWSKTGNKCLPNTPCKTFKEIYGTATAFCEKVWDESWKSTPNEEPCMRMWFNGSKGNPNDKIAQFYVQLLLDQASGHNRETATVSMVTSLAILAVLV